MGYRRDIRRGAPRWTQWVFATLFVLFVAGGIYAGYLFYATVRDLVAHAQVKSFPLLGLPSGSNHDGDQTSGKGSEGPFYDFDRPEGRINILLLGIDQRPGETGPFRTDTMIVFSIDPEHKRASILSIPRDLWVPIPGYGQGRINTAHYLGDLYNYPGGGPALAKHTVQYNLGIPIHYYVRINFSAFERFIDTIGGIDVVVPKTIDDPAYPDDQYGTIHLHIEAGPHHFNGKEALQYARTRHADSDFGRIERQQQIIFAVRDRVMDLNLIPQLLPKLPQLLRDMGDTVQTDLRPEDIVQIAQWVQEIPRDQIESGMIDRSMTEDMVTEDGAQVLLYIRDRARPLIDHLFRENGNSKTEEEKLLEQVQAEQASVIVLNGTTFGGVAGRTSEFLRQQGFNVINFGNADHFDYEHTLLQVYSEKPATVSYLAELFGIAEENIHYHTEISGDADLVIIIGADFPRDVIE